MAAGLLVLALLTFSGVVAWLYLTVPQPRDVEGWTLGPPLPDARGELATAVAHDGPCDDPPCPELERLYVLGGLAGLGQVVDRVDVYDPDRRRWSAAPPLPAPRHHPAAAGLDGAVYLSGGTVDRRRPWSPEDDLWRLEAGGEAWEQLPSMPEGRWGHRMVAHDGRLWVVGGEGPSSRVLVFDPEDGWDVRAEMPVPRDHLSVVVVDGRIWAIGGRVPESLARVDIYDPEADEWTPGPDLPEPTSGAAEGVVDGVILVLGGEEARLLGGEIFDRHWMLDTRATGDGARGEEAPADGEWMPAPPPPLAVHGADGAVFQGEMVIAGGASRHGALSVTAWADAFQRMLNPEAP